MTQKGARAGDCMAWTDNNQSLLKREYNAQQEGRLEQQGTQLPRALDDIEECGLRIESYGESQVKTLQFDLPLAMEALFAVENGMDSGSAEGE